MMNSKILLSTLFRNSDDNTSLKPQGGSLKQKAERYLSKGTKTIEKNELKFPKIKQEDNAVSKLLNNIKGKKDNQFEGAQKDSAFNVYKAKKTIVVAEPIEIEPSPQISVELLYNKNYGDEMEKHLYFAMVRPL